MGRTLVEPKIAAIIQARVGSTRLPGKVLAEVAGRPMLAHVVERAMDIPHVTEVILASTTNPADEAIVAWARQAGIPCVRGSEEDVLDRFRLAARERAVDVIVRVTSDCPLLDPEVSGLVVREYLERGDTVDYVSNVHPPTYPDGLDTEVFSRRALEAAWHDARLPSDREHVTTYIWRHPERFRLANVSHEEDLSAHRWTVDTGRDLAFVRAVFEATAGDQRPIRLGGVIALLNRRPEIRELNAGQQRNEGLMRSVAGDRIADGGS